MSDDIELDVDLDGAAEYILTNYVAPIAEDIMRSHIRTDVYGAYTPKANGWRREPGADGVWDRTYLRRYDLDRNVESFMEGSDTLAVTSTAEANTSIGRKQFVSSEKGAFLGMIETGGWGRWRGGFSRPAISNTQKEFDSSPEIRRAIERGLKDLGLSE